MDTIRSHSHILNDSLRAAGLFGLRNRPYSANNWRVVRSAQYLGMIDLIIDYLVTIILVEFSIILHDSPVKKPKPLRIMAKKFILSTLTIYTPICIGGAIQPHFPSQYHHSITKNRNGVYSVSFMKFKPLLLHTFESACSSHIPISPFRSFL